MASTLKPASSQGGGGGGSGTVTSVSSPDTSLVVTSPTTTPSLQVGTLDVIATNEPPAANWSNNSKRITSLADPAAAQDAATKNYVDTAINGLDWKAATLWATTSALPANTYANGASGVGATLTGTAFGALSIDGNTPSVGDRVLVKNEVTGSHNGVYTVTVVGGVATLYVLTRSTDYNQASEIAAGDAFYVISGTANADTSWVMTTTGAIVVGTTALTFVQFGGQLVSSVFTRTGAVTAQTGDYTAAQVGALASTASLDAIAAANVTAGDWSNNSHKITSLAAATLAADAAPFSATFLRWSRPTGALYETFPRFLSSTNLSPLVSQFVTLRAINLPSGVVITSISFVSGTTALSAGVNQVFGLYDNSLNLLATTTDDTSTAWAANSVKTLNLTPGTFTTTYTGLHYLAILINATVPSLTGFSPGSVTNILNGLTPLLGGQSSGGRTTLPNPAAAISSAPTGVVYAYVS